MVRDLNRFVMKKRLRIEYAIIYLSIAVVSCVTSMKLTPTPSATMPPVPEIYHNLPLETTAECPEASLRPRGSITIWEHIAQRPQDSSLNPDRGNPVGLIDLCEVVTVVDYGWSEEEQEFWLMIETSDGTTGWLSSKLIKLDG